MKICLAIFAGCLFCLAGLRGNAADPSAPAGELDKLGAFVGHWKASGELKDKAETKVSAEMSCNWAANHGFLICDQMIHTPDGVQNDLSIYTYSEKEHGFQFFGITRGSKEARSTKLTIEENIWTYSSEETNNGKKTQYRTINKFFTPSHVDWRSEYSEDGEHWTVTAEGSDARAN